MSSNSSEREGDVGSPEYNDVAHWPVDSYSSTNSNDHFDFDSFRECKDIIEKDKLEQELEQATVAIERRMIGHNLTWENDDFEFMENDLQDDRERLIVLLLKKICSFRDPSNSLYITCCYWFFKQKILTSAKYFTGSPTPKLPRVIARSDKMNGLLRSLNISTYTRDFIEEEHIGSGGFGTVFRARHKVDGRSYAVKKIMFKCRHFMRNFADTLLREVQVLSRVTSCNVARYYGAFIEQCSEEDAQRMCEDRKDNQPTWTPSDSKLNSSTVYNSTIHTFENKAGFDPPLIQARQLNKQVPQLSVNIFPETEKYQHLQLFLLMEFCGYNTLWDYIIAPDRVVNLSEIMYILVQCLYALEALHLLQIVHRDVKPGNIFLKPPEDINLSKPEPYFSGTLVKPNESAGVRSITGKRTFPSISRCVVKLGDFGLAKFCNVHRIDEPSKIPIIIEGSKPESLTSNVGTRLYAAPEIFDGSEYGVKVDIYSLGILFFELLNPPFGTMHERMIALSDLRNGKVPEEIGEKFGVEITEMLERMVDRNPATRASAIELLNMDIVKGYTGNGNGDSSQSKHTDLQEDKARKNYSLLSKRELVELLLVKDRTLADQKIALESKERIIKGLKKPLVSSFEASR